MARVITFSRYFPSYHPKAGEPTLFVEKFWNSIYDDLSDIPFELARELKIVDCDEAKHHTIREGKRFKAGDYFSPRVWSGKPYASKQIKIAHDIKIRKVWDFELTFDDLFYINEELYAYSSSHDALETLARNDGLEQVDLLNWFNKPFEGQIICWNKDIEY
jgi:hypothetical protein